MVSFVIISHLCYTVPSDNCWWDCARHMVMHICTVCHRPITCMPFLFWVKWTKRNSPGKNRTACKLPVWSDLPSSGILHSVERQFLADVSGQPVGPIFKGQEFQELLTLEDGTDRLSRNVGKATLRCVISQNTADLIYIAVEAWNHAAYLTSKYLYLVDYCKLPSFSSCFDWSNLHVCSRLLSWLRTGAHTIHTHTHYTHCTTSQDTHSVNSQTTDWTSLLQKQ